MNLQIKESENNSNHITSNHISSHATEHLTAAARRCYCAMHAAQWAAVSHSEGLQVQLQSVWAVQRRARKHSSHWSWGQEDTQQVQVILKTTAEETVSHGDLLLQCAQPHSTLYQRGPVATTRHLVTHAAHKLVPTLCSSVLRSSGLESALNKDLLYSSTSCRLGCGVVGGGA